MVLDRESRINFILDRLSEGKSYPEIDDLLRERNRRRKVLQKEQGDSSELQARSILTSLDFVKFVERTKSCGFQDSRGRDLKIVLEPESLKKFLGRQPVISSVWVQVKTGERSALLFERRFGESHEEIEEELCRRHLIVIHTDADEEEIRQSFKMQLDKIDRFWQKTGKRTRIRG